MTAVLAVLAIVFLLVGILAGPGYVVVAAVAAFACPKGGVVLDPFAGSGTVGLVANRLSRRAVLIDLNPAYLEQQMRRNAQVPVGL